MIMFERFKRMGLKFKHTDLGLKKNSKISIHELYELLVKLQKDIQKHNTIVYVIDFIYDLNVVLNAIENNNRKINKAVLKECPYVKNVIEIMSNIDMEFLKTSNDLEKTHKIYSDIEKADFLLLDMIDKYRKHLVFQELIMRSPTNEFEYKNSISRSKAMHSSSVTESERRVMNRNGKMCAQHAISELQSINDGDLIKTGIIDCFKQLNETLDKKESDELNSEYYYYCDPYVVEDINNFVDYVKNRNSYIIHTAFYRENKLNHIEKMKEIINFSYELNRVRLKRKYEQDRIFF